MHIIDRVRASMVCIILWISILYINNNNNNTLLCTVFIELPTRPRHRIVYKKTMGTRPVHIAYYLLVLRAECEYTLHVYVLINDDDAMTARWRVDDDDANCWRSEDSKRVQAKNLHELNIMCLYYIIYIYLLCIAYSGECRIWEWLKTLWIRKAYLFVPIYARARTAHNIP